MVEIISRSIWYLDNSVSPSSSLIPLNSRLLSRSQSFNLPSFLFSSRLLSSSLHTLACRCSFSDFNSSTLFSLCASQAVSARSCMMSFCSGISAFDSDLVISLARILPIFASSGPRSSSDSSVSVPSTSIGFSTIIGAADADAEPFVMVSSMLPLEVAVFSLPSSICWLCLGVVVSSLFLVVDVFSLCLDDCWLCLVAVASSLCLVVSISLLLLGPVLEVLVVGSVVSMLLLVMLSIINFFWGFVVASILGGVLLLLFLISMLFVGVQVVLGFEEGFVILPNFDALFVLTDVFLVCGPPLLPLAELVEPAVFFSLCSLGVLCALGAVSALLFSF